MQINPNNLIIIKYWNDFLVNQENIPVKLPFNYDKTYPIETLQKNIFLDYDDIFLNMSLNKPRYLRINNENNIIVFDAGSGSVGFYVFDTQKRFLKKFGRSGQGPGDFSGVVDFNIDSKGNVYILELNNVRISVFNKYFQFKRTIKLNKIYDESNISLYKDSLLIINNPSSEYYISVYDTLGNLLQNVGKITESKKENYPTNISYGVGNTFFDSINKRYIIFLKYLPIIKIYDLRGTLYKIYCLEYLSEYKKRVESSVNNNQRGGRSKYYYNIINKNGKYYILIRVYDKNKKIETITLYILNNDFQVTSKQYLLTRFPESIPKPTRGSAYLFDTGFDILNDGSILYMTDEIQSIIYYFLLK